MAPQAPISTSTQPPASTFTPHLKPPPGVIPNPEHPASLAHLSNLTIAVCVPLITTFFLLRTYVRVVIKRTWIFEDVLTTMAWASTVAYCGIMGATMSHHGGEHGWDITDANAHEAAYWFNVASIEYGVSICIAKLAVLWLYRRVFSPTKKSLFDITIVFLITILFGFYGITTFFKIFECNPRAKIFNPTIKGKCFNVPMILKVSGLFNTITDYIILLLPIHAVTKLQMSTQKKLLVILVFTFGSCAPIFATIGFVVRLRNSSNPDTTWKQPEILLWGAAELTSGNLCVCFPEIGALFRKSTRSGSKPYRPTGDRGHYGGTIGSGRASKKDPYMSKGLTDIETSSAENPYIELDDSAYGAHAHITSGRIPGRGEVPRNGTVLMKSEIRVVRHEVI